MAPSLWAQAAATLDTEDSFLIDAIQDDNKSLIEEVLIATREKQDQCLQRRWKYTDSRGNDVVIRDLFAKVVTWVDRFKQIGDCIVQYDPAHAALPWAGVRLLLQLTINDSQTFGAMAEGVELVSHLVARYTIVETLYLSRPSKVKEELEKAMLKFYAAVLRYISKAYLYFKGSTFKRAIDSALQTSDNVASTHLAEITETQAKVDACTALVSAELAVDTGDEMKAVKGKVVQINSTQETLVADQAQMKALLEDLERPITRIATQLKDIEDSLNEAERERIFQWLSSVQYMKHHRAKAKSILPDSCQWLFEKDKFIDWRKSSSSAILWLHGIPGSGKSILVSSFVEKVIRENDSNAQPVPLAYFYCTRDAAEPERAEPDEIMRSILEQLSSSDIDMPIREPVVKAFQARKRAAKGRAPEPLELEDTVDIILTLLEENPAIIIIDALDECNPRTRQDLMLALHRLTHDSASLLKVLVSSRDDQDIVHRLGRSPDVYISSEENSADIARFVQTQVSKAINEEKLIHGKVSLDLKNHIVTTLIDKAAGMFRLASLHIQSLCDPQRIKTQENVEQALKQLPQELNESYAITFAQISSSQTPNPQIAKRVMRWLICAQRPLTTIDFIEAIRFDSLGHASSVSKTEILDICCNMVVLDSEADVFRFAHLSVREYLEGLSEYGLSTAHALALERCLATYQISMEGANMEEFYQAPNYKRGRRTRRQSSISLARRRSLQTILGALKNEIADTKTPTKEQTFRDYATTFWPTHLRLASKPQLDTKLNDKLTAFLFQNHTTAASFVRWVTSAKILIAEQSNYGDVTTFDEEFYKKREALHFLSDTVSEPPTPLFVACSFGIMAIFEKLCASITVDWNQKNVKGRTAIHLAADRGFNEIATLLIAKGADLSTRDTSKTTAMYAAAKNGHLKVVKQLLEQKAEVDARNPRQETALYQAARVGNETLCQLLLDFNADINAENIHLDTPLHAAARSGRAPIVTFLIGHGSRVEVANNDGLTPLLVAIIKEDQEMCEQLLKLGSDPNAKKFGKTSALQLALGHESTDIAELLVKNGALIDPLMLHSVVSADRKDQVELLLQNKANIRAQDTNGETVIDAAIRTKNEEMFTVLLKYTTDLEIRDQFGDTLLHAAIKSGFVAAVNALLSKGANAGARDENGKSVLQRAINGRSRDVLHIFLPMSINNTQESEMFVKKKAIQTG